MSSIAKMIETIESELDAKTEEVAANPEHLRMVEALLFAASEPLDQKALSTSLPEAPTTIRICRGRRFFRRRTDTGHRKIR